MQVEESALRDMLSRGLMGVMIRIALIAFLVVMCARIFAPFANLMMWGLILAVALYPLHQMLARRLGGRQGRAATILVLAGLLLIWGPTVMLGSSFATHAHDTYTDFQAHSIAIPRPDPAVADWPLIGKKVHAVWSSAADNLPEFLKNNQALFKNIAQKMLIAAANTAGSVLLFLGAMIIAGFMMAFGEAGSRAMLRIVCRLTDPVTGPRLHRLTTATIRSVASGVIGVAIIQALLLGIGFMMAGIPAPGVLALLVLLFGILQLPVFIVTLPAIAYLWWSGDASTTLNVVFTIYLLVAGFVDNVLKPLLLGRGVDVPMPVILIGALGGMVSAGIIGLFIGAVLLAVGYQVFMEWVGESEAGEAANSENAAVASRGTTAGV